MAQIISFNGSNYTIPDVNDTDWGQNVTDFLTAIPNGTLQPTGGLFSLSAEVDFGANFGLRSVYFKSRTTNPASAGAVRLARTDSVAWRNNANSADLLLTVNASDQLVFNGLVLEGDLLPSAQMFVGDASNSSTPRTISGAWTMSNLGVATLSPDYIVNSMINSAAAIAFSKMAALTADRMLISNSSGVVAASAWEYTAVGSHLRTGAEQQLQWQDSTTRQVNVAAPTTLTSTYTIKWPTDPPAADEFLRSDASGNMRWDAAAGSGVINSGLTNQIAYYPAAGMTLSGATSFTVDVAGKLLSFSDTNIGNPVIFELQNADNTDPASNARIQVVSQLGGGDAYYRAVVSGGSGWSFGVDNSDSDRFKISSGSVLGTGDVIILQSNAILPQVDVSLNVAAAGAIRFLEVINPDNTNALSHARLNVQTGGASSGDPFVLWTVSGGQSYYAGIDNNDSDNFYLGRGTVVGTSPGLRFDTSGNFNFTGDLEINTATPSLTFRTTGATPAEYGIDYYVQAVQRFSIKFDNSPGELEFQSHAAADTWGFRFLLTPSGGSLGDADFNINSNQSSFARGLVGTDLLMQVHNTDNTNAASGARLSARVGGSSGGDPHVLFSIDGSTQWTIGVDNSASDHFVIANQVGVGGTQKVRIDGVNNQWIFTSSGNNSFPTLTGTLDTDTGILFLNGSTNFVAGGGQKMNISTTTVGVLAGDVSDPGLSFLTATSTGLYLSGGTMNVTVAGNQIAQFTSNLTRFFQSRVVPSGAGALSLGDATEYWGDISYKTLTDRGCLPWCDDGVELMDGKVVSDLDAICSIEKHPTKKTVHGLPMLNYNTFPKKAYRAADLEGKLLPRDGNNEPYWMDNGVKKNAADGIEMTMMFGVMIGAFKQTKQKFDSIEDRIKKLEQKVGA